VVPGAVHHVALTTPSHEGAKPLGQWRRGSSDEAGEVTVLEGERAGPDRGVHGDRHGRHLLRHTGGREPLEVLLGRDRPVGDIPPEDVAECDGEVVVVPGDVTGQFVGLAGAPRW
jgi:hypothetical protein